MSYILALFAFAGIMAVMSTVVTVVVEAVHKVFGMRGSGMQEMLRALHDGVVMPLDPAHPHVTTGVEGGSTREASEFARQMTKSPAYGGKGRWWWMSNVPVLRLFRRRFENLSKLQFVEQLSQTDYGQRLGNMNRAQVRQSLNRLVYEFDRYGAGQSDFFRARAKVLTSFIALAIVMLGNINALSIYRHLATDSTAAQSILASLGDNPAALQGFMQRSAAQAQLSTDGGSPQAFAQEFAVQVSQLSNAGFPVGRDYFPYCGNDLDHYCDVETWLKPVKIPIINYTSEAIPRMLTPEGAQWIIGMIATAGLVGLGAPFWFGLFKTMATIALRQTPGSGGAAVRAATVVSVAPGEVRRPSDAKGSLAAPGSEPDLDVLTDAFLTVSGKDVAAGPPMGRRVGDATADRLASGSPVPAAANPAMKISDTFAGGASLAASGSHKGTPPGPPQSSPRGIRQYRG